MECLIYWFGIVTPEQKMSSGINVAHEGHMMRIWTLIDMIHRANACIVVALDIEAEVV